MLLGLFVVPGARSGWATDCAADAAGRGDIWGALTGYCVAACVALYASMVPAAMWAADDTVRGLLGFWSLIIGPAAGALIGNARGITRRA